MNPTHRNYNEIVKVAKSIKKNVSNNYKLGENEKWGYYIAKAILKPKTKIKRISFDKAPKPTGTHISRQLSKSEVKGLAKDLIEFVEGPKKRMPNYLTYKSYKIRTRLYIHVLAKALVFYDENGRLPNETNINSKAFYKPSETGNTVYDYFVKKTGKKYDTIDEMLTYVKAHWKYEFYFDDHKSNKQVIDEKSGNCTDLLQFMWNWAKAKGYECRCIHVKCKVSGTGHVRGQFKHPKHTGGKWINRDIASVADGGSITSIWCSDGLVLATNPSWFLENKNR